MRTIGTKAVGVVTIAVVLLAARIVDAQIDSKNPRARKCVFDGEIACGKKEYDKAISLFSQAIRLDPENGEIYYGRGMVYDRARNFDKAIADYSEAIRLIHVPGPELADAYNNRGISYGRKGDFDKAIADLTVAINRFPEQGHFVLFGLLDDRPDALGIVESLTEKEEDKVQSVSLTLLPNR